MKKLLLLLSIVYTQEITNITLEQRTDGSGFVDVCYDLTGTEDFSLFFITAEINFDGDWLPVSGASGEIGSAIEVGGSKCFEWNVKNQYPENTLSVFIMPPSIKELEIRLRKRGTESEEKIKNRLNKSKEELPL